MVLENAMVYASIVAVVKMSEQPLVLLLAVDRAVEHCTLVELSSSGIRSYPYP